MKRWTGKGVVDSGTLFLTHVNGKNMKGIHIVIDLETMGTGPESAIVAIGALKVDLDCDNPHIIDFNHFYRTIDLSSSCACGGVVDVDTVKFWMQQDKYTQSEIIHALNDISSTLRSLSAWMTCADPITGVWGNGASFDNVILSSAYRKTGIERPWNCKCDRDLRTLKYLVPEVEMVNSKVPHHAFEDAYAEALYLVKAIKHLRGKKD